MFIFKGHFTNENEARQLLKTFMQNLFETTPAIRRSTASALVGICVGCRKPGILLTWLLETLLLTAIPFQSMDEISPNKVLGILVTISPSEDLEAKSKRIIYLYRREQESYYPCFVITKTKLTLRKTSCSSVAFRPTSLCFTSLTIPTRALSRRAWKPCSRF